MVKRALSVGEVVQSHQHVRGHITLIIGHAIMRMGDGAEHSVIDSDFWVPAGMAHEIIAVTGCKMFCIGAEDF